jgi:hypothetical protein
MGTIGNNCISEAAESPAHRPTADHGHDLLCGVAGFGELVLAALRTISSGSRPKSLIYRRLIVICAEHPICNFTVKQRLVRELP